MGPRSFRKHAKPKAGVGLAIFPEETITLGNEYTIPESDLLTLKKRVKEDKSGLADKSAPVAIVCILYQDMETDAFHQTPYYFALFNANVGGDPVISTLMEPGPIPVSLIDFEPVAMAPPPT